LRIEKEKRSKGRAKERVFVHLGDQATTINPLQTSKGFRGQPIDPIYLCKSLTFDKEVELNEHTPSPPPFNCFCSMIFDSCLAMF